jgi:hypothetical protein
MPKTRSSRTKKADSDDDSIDYQAILASSDDDDDSSVEEPKRMPSTKTTPTKPKKAAPKPVNTTPKRKQAVKMAGDPPINNNSVPFLAFDELKARHQQTQAETVPFSDDSGYWLWFLMEHGKDLHDYDVERRREEKNVVDVKSKALPATPDCSC